ncbi:MAG: cupredoxin domain-containing protein [Actinomycetota bacterium]|nr:cupredoxin domain-containing protein [Actinomycetota bacterium]
MTTNTFLSRLGAAALIPVLALGVACGDDDNEEAGSGTALTTTTAINAVPPTTAPATGSGATTTVGQLTAPTASANPNAITIQNFAFSGIEAARANTTWSISNRDSVPHTVSADDGSFVWRVEPGQTTPFAKTLAPGSYPIHCDVHPSAMRGVLVVR